MKVGIVGCGAIGRKVATELDRGYVPGTRLGALSSRDLGRTMEFARSLQEPPPVVPLYDLVPLVDLVMEAAGGHAVDSIARATLEAGKDLMVLSCGALLERDDLVAMAQERGANIYVASGAIAGLDGVMGAAGGRIDSLTMITRKPPQSLKGAPGMVGNPVDLDTITEPAVVFEGPVIEACRQFPANVNVSAALAMAGLGPQETKIKILADPTISRNTHEIIVTGEFGLLQVYIENVPSESNPKTGIIAALSALATLKKIASPLKVGT